MKREYPALVQGVMNLLREKLGEGNDIVMYIVNKLLYPTHPYKQITSTRKTILSVIFLAFYAIAVSPRSQYFLPVWL